MENIPKTISDTIDILATKFGSTGTHLWTIMIQRVLLDAWFGIIFGAIFLLVVAICWCKLGMLDEDKEVSPFKVLPYCLGIILGLLFIFMNITSVVLPEATLLNSIINSSSCN